jgi:hypothetical protein
MTLAQAQNIIGTSVFGQALSGGTLTASGNAAMQSAAYNSMLQNAHSASNPPIIGNSGASNKRIFAGHIDVSQVANGYVVNIATKEGYEFTTYIASTIVEVNKIIAAAMVAFQLEDK